MDMLHGSGVRADEIGHPLRDNTVLNAASFHEVPKCLGSPSELQLVVVVCDLCVFELLSQMVVLSQGKELDVPFSQEISLNPIAGIGIENIAFTEIQRVDANENVA